MYIHMLVRVLATATAAPVRKRRSLRRSRAAALAPHATPTIDWRRCPRAPLHARSTMPDASGSVLYRTDLLCACLARPQDTCLCGLLGASASVAPDSAPWLNGVSDSALVLVNIPEQRRSASSPRLPRLAPESEESDLLRRAMLGFVGGVLLGLLGCALVVLGMVL